MEIKLPESSYINPPHKVEGKMADARLSFYELAKEKVKLMNSEEFRIWNRSFSRIGIGDPDYDGACGYFWTNTKFKDNKTVEKFVKNIEIGINVDDFIIDGISYKDLIPFIIEHEIYEGWLNCKKGFLGNAYEDEEIETKHQLALRREFYLAEKSGMGEKLFEWRKKNNPDTQEDCRNALRSAKRKLAKNLPM